jgi:hypothetical protein
MMLWDEVYERLPDRVRSSSAVLLFSPFSVMCIFSVQVSTHKDWVDIAAKVAPGAKIADALCQRYREMLQPVLHAG